MTERHSAASTPPRLDFDGDYGRSYRHTIRNAVPGYDSLIEIGTAALQQAVPASLLVVGPGPGDELLPLLQALPQTRLTLLEPSQQMADACGAVIAQAEASARCDLLHQGLEPGVLPAAAPFEAVLCHNVLHLMPAGRQLALLHTLAACVAPGGSLLLSAHSEPADHATLEAMLPVALARLRLRGLDQAMIEKLMACRNSLVFPVDEQRVAACFTEAGLTPPLLLQQSLFSRLWLSRRPG